MTALSLAGPSTTRLRRFAQDDKCNRNSAVLRPSTTRLRRSAQTIWKRARGAAARQSVLDALSRRVCAGPHKGKTPTPIRENVGYRYTRQRYTRKGPAMSKHTASSSKSEVLTFVGLDVHKYSIAIAVADHAGVRSLRTIANTSVLCARLCAGWVRPRLCASATSRPAAMSSTVSCAG